ncbi:MAG: DUF4011 domain-containing protein, partial [Methylococcales bacterium]|nr:DUF4011 domain-containing protein [Methylococcales bacterium]
EVDEQGQDKRLRKDPSAKEWAACLGLNASVTLPVADGELSSKHQDNALQTLLFPHQMETTLRNIRNKAATAIEETGANILYLALGFLQWFEVDNDKARLAPLYLVPVQLNRGKLDKKTGTYFYSLSYSGEDIVTNLSLREKLRIDFGLGLPDLEYGTLPEAYFQQVESIISHNQPSWSLLRQASLALLNYGKLLMYLDLDPERWPEGEGNITAHSIVQRFFMAQHETSEHQFGQEYEIDQIENIHYQYPLINDADSSQHSAMIDVLKGKNLVIEGPPGSGKSQTITNLIAAALSQNKKVLFVAEKLAALEVVKHRLDQAGLGDFCLELHSHKTQKRKVLNDIGTRIRNQDSYRNPEQIDAEILRYEKLKQQLNEHANIISQTWYETGDTVYDVLMAAARYRLNLTISPMDLHPVGFDQAAFNPAAKKILADAVKLYQAVTDALYEQLDDDFKVSSHPWYGVGNRTLQLFDHELVGRKLKGWQNQLAVLKQAAPELNNSTKGLVSVHSVSGFKRYLADLIHLPELNGSESVARLPALSADVIVHVSQYLSDFSHLQGLHQAILKTVKPEYLDQLDQLTELASASEVLKAYVGDPARSLLALHDDIQLLSTAIKQVDALAPVMLPVSESVGDDLNVLLHPSRSGLSAFKQLLMLVDGVPGHLWGYRDDCFDRVELDELLPVLADKLAELKPQYEVLSNQFDLTQLPMVPVLQRWQNVLANAGFFKWFDGEWREARKQVLQLSIFPGAGLSTIISQLPDLIVYAQTQSDFDQDRRYQVHLQAYFKGLDTDIESLKIMRQWYAGVRAVYGQGFGARVAAGNALIALPNEVIVGLQSLIQQGTLQQLIECDLTLTKLEGQVTVLTDQDKDLTGEHGLSDNLAIFSHASALCESFLVDSVTVDQLDTEIQALNQLSETQHQWQQLTLPEWVRSEWPLSLSEAQDEVFKAACHTVDLAKVVAELETVALTEAILAQSTAEYIQGINAFLPTLTGMLEEYDRAEQAFAALAEVDLVQWMAVSGDDVDTLSTRNEQALSRMAWLDQWVNYIRQRFELSEAGLDPLLAVIEQHQLDVTDIESAFYLGVYDAMARSVFEQYPALSHFDAQSHETLQQQFADYDQTLLKLQRERIAWQVAQNDIPSGRSGGKVSQYTELALLKHESGKKMRHIPIRQLVLRAGSALTALKPCFMMGPMSVAQYLAPGQFEFDLVIMDEASQVRPEDALGAIARSKQVVVVGDPKQLPPTNFFNRILETDDDDLSAIEESQSILDAAMPLFSARRLRWHYRSEHASLISFSNRSFYEQNLVVFPSPYAQSADFGVSFTAASKGCFVKGCNTEEATIIAHKVSVLLQKYPDDSVGVVAMNSDQRDQIERAIESLSKQDNDFYLALEQNRVTAEPLFIKNLENVQGDERDTIVISFTYGPKEIGGKVPQRFGPINMASGWRRMNVLLTRAKKRMQIVSSMLSDNITLSEKSSRGVIALKEFLAFAEHGEEVVEHKSALKALHDHELAIREALVAREVESESQVGVSGFYVDLAIQDPAKSQFILGIETDGALYQSAKSARDRDRLRSAVLQRLGWNMLRSWSVTWFKQPEVVVEHILQNIAQIRLSLPEVKTPDDEAEGADNHTESVSVEAQYLDVNQSLLVLLQSFKAEVVLPAYPETLEANQLLRPAMVDAFTTYRPVSLWEYEELMPEYLLAETAEQELVFLEAIFKIISHHLSADVQV